MTWRLAKCLGTLRDQVNAQWPNRNKGNDGTIGDERHQQEHSEHNPDAHGVVRAEDISNDPAHGVVSDKIAHALIDSRDPRILYVISNGRICSSQVSPWVWRPYHGSNPHDHHFHLSVVADPKLYDDTRPWAIGQAGDAGGPILGAAHPAPVPLPAPAPQRKIIFQAHGKMSTFGGPDDTGMRSTEGLALWNSAAQMVQHGLGDYLVGSLRFPGLGRRLNPSKAYLACRWDYNRTPVEFLQNALAYVMNDATGEIEKARPMDWGPNVSTGRVADLSPGLAKRLKLETNNSCTVIIYEDGK